MTDALTLMADSLLPFNARVLNGGEISLYALFTAACVAAAGVGFLLASRVPRNAIGWLVSLIDRVVRRGEPLPRAVRAC